MQSEQAIEVAQRASRGEVGRLAIGFVGSATYSVLPPAVRSFRHQFPDVRLMLHEMTTTEQIEALHDDRIQLGFIRPPISDDELSVETVLQESFVAVLPEAHPLATQTQLSLASLAEESFILSPRHLGSGFYDQIIRLCQQAGFIPQVTQEATQMQTIVSLVAAELGVALVPASLQNLQRAGVVYKPLEDQTLYVKLAVVWRSANTSPVLHQFLAQSRTVTRFSAAFH